MQNITVNGNNALFFTGDNFTNMFGGDSTIIRESARNRSCSAPIMMKMTIMMRRRSWSRRHARNHEDDGGSKAADLAALNWAFLAENR